MTVAALYDIHGNLPALEAVVGEVERCGAGAVLVGGDVVPGPMPREALARLLDLDPPARFIRGNGESAVLAELRGEDPGSLPAEAIAAIRWTAEALSADEARTMDGWPPTLRVDLPGVGRVVFCHATPESDTAIFTRRTPDERLLTLLGEVEADVVICGHTHMPFDRRVGGIRVVNAGSVGMPFGRSGADWLLLGPGVEPRHTDYDLEAAADLIRRTAYPGADAFAERFVLDPPPEDAMLEAYAGADRGWREAP